MYLVYKSVTQRIMYIVYKSVTQRIMYLVYKSVTKCHVSCAQNHNKVTENQVSNISNTVCKRTALPACCWPVSFPDKPVCKSKLDLLIRNNIHQGVQHSSGSVDTTVSEPRQGTSPCTLAQAVCWLVCHTMLQGEQKLSQWETRVWSLTTKLTNGQSAGCKVLLSRPLFLKLWYVYHYWHTNHCLVTGSITQNWNINKNKN